MFVLQLNFAEARKNCQSYGMDLVVVEGSIENEFILGQIKLLSVYILISMVAQVLGANLSRNKISR